MSRDSDRGKKRKNRVAAKRGQPDDQTIKEFAETAMNELLGLYGYGKVDSRDTLGLSLHRFTAAHSPPMPPAAAAAAAAAATNTSGSSPLRPTTHSPSRLLRHSPPASASHSPQHHASDHEGDSLDSEDMPVSGHLEHGLRSVSPGKTDQGSGSSRGSTPKSVFEKVIRLRIIEHLERINLETGQQRQQEGVEAAQQVLSPGNRRKKKTTQSSRRKMWRRIRCRRLTRVITQGGAEELMAGPDLSPRGGGGGRGEEGGGETGEGEEEEEEEEEYLEKGGI
nr:uncharacterized protein LOC123765170 [Procambarus clarkii]